MGCGGRRQRSCDADQGGGQLWEDTAAGDATARGGTAATGGPKPAGTGRPWRELGVGEVIAAWVGGIELQMELFVNKARLAREDWCMVLLLGQFWIVHGWLGGIDKGLWGSVLKGSVNSLC